MANTELRRKIFATMMISQTSQKFLAREINIGLQNKDLKIGEQSWQERNKTLIKKNQVDLEKKNIDLIKFQFVTCNITKCINLFRLQPAQF